MPSIQQKEREAVLRELADTTILERRQAEEHRKALMEAAGCDRDTAKKVYLSKLNGGCRAYTDITKRIKADN